MSSENRPLNSSNAPDTARVYERAKPEAESGAGRLDNNKFKPADRPDAAETHAVEKAPSRQINAEETPDPRKTPQQRK